ncbi:glycosyltransferase [Mycobacterium sp. pUA109]|uniref:glycosyltransferase n=1 Tax=Mycobacterium sp. pUA109 TaxID=3238982 RepID=UPI00351AFD6A
MKFALACVGSRGDVEPFAAVGRELLRRGHDVRMAFPPNMLGFIESAGLAAVGYGPDARALQDPDFVRSFGPARSPANVLGEIMEQVTQFWPQMGTTLTSLAHGADLLLTEASSQGLAANVAEYYGIPLATLRFFPALDTEPDDPCGPVVTGLQDAQRRELGLPPVTERGSPPVLEIQAYDEFWFPELVAAWAEQNTRRPFVGSLTLELPTDADEEVLSWIAEATPPIYFGFGSSVRVAFPAQAVAVISAACAQLGERALICAGGSDFTQVPHFDNVKVVDAVNHATVFPACRAIVHHGGAGTTAAAMRAGIPALIQWLWVDQPIWAAAVERFQVGIGRRFSAVTPDVLVRDLRTILSPQFALRAREVASNVTKPAESVANAADLLEDAVRSAQTVLPSSETD